MRKWISNDTVLMAQWAAEGFDTPMDASISSARLSSRVQEIVRKKKECKVFHWTDSKIVLFWIKGSSKSWKQFVANRVQEISKLTILILGFIAQDKTIPSDFLSRGLSVDTLISNNKWWTGPAFLRTDELPKTVSECPELNEVDYLPELKSKDFNILYRL
ncbi:integrase catalytic domain-containing protein [Trichonephila clavipes]|nr:integrase catalytic domain-containing protein [Trichonephila clavipes]